MNPRIRIWLIFAMVSLSAIFQSCGLIRKSVDTTSNIEYYKKDSTKTVVTINDVLSSTIEKLDNSKILITTYSPEKDSITGAQKVESTIEIKKDIKTTTVMSKDKDSTVITQSNVIESSKKDETSKAAQSSRSATIKWIAIAVIAIASAYVINKLFGLFK